MEPGKKGQIQGEAGWGLQGCTLTFLLTLFCLGKKKGWECISRAVPGPACKGVGPKKASGARGKGHNTGFRGCLGPQEPLSYGEVADSGQGAQSSLGPGHPQQPTVQAGDSRAGFRCDLRE